MDTSKFAVELAERRIEQERDASVARVRGALAKPGAGASHCLCGAAIPEARRQALPGVRLCVDCAAEREARSKR